MKRNLSGPVIAGTLIVVLLVIGAVYFHSMTASPHTPRPNPAMFSGKPGSQPDASTAKKP